MTSSALDAATPVTPPAESTTAVDRRRTVWGLLAVVFAPAMVLIPAATAFLRGWQPAIPLDRWILETAGAWLGLTVVIAGLPSGRRWLATRAPGLLAMTFSMVVSWLLLHVVVGWMEPALIAGYHRRAPHVNVIFEPDAAIMPGIQGSSHYTTNAHGIRGPELPSRREAYRILCVGGSTTECIYVDNSETWTQRIMDRLNAAGNGHYWCGGVGVSGNSTAHHLKFLRESPLVEEMDCLVFLIGINDLYWAYSDMESRYATEVLSSPAYPWWVLTPVHRVLATELGDVKRDVTTVRDEFLATISTEDFLGRYYVQRRALRQQAETIHDIPDLTPSIQDYQDRVRAIIALSRARGIPVVFATQPVLWRDDLSDDLNSRIWFGRLADGRYLDVSALRHAMDRYNAALVDVCAESGAPLVDLTDISGREEFFYDDCHFTELGARTVGDRIAAWFKAHPAP